MKNNAPEKSPGTLGAGLTLKGKVQPSGGYIQEKTLTVELPDISDQVPYVYVNHVRLSSNKWDLRLAFGEIGPTGKLEPRTGVILPHLVAKGLMRALGRIIENIEGKIGEIKDPDEPSKVVTTQSKSSGGSKKK